MRAFALLLEFGYSLGGGVRSRLCIDDASEMF